jgi:membrane dipeptidase
MMRRWFDAHLDLAALAENGRDMTRGLEDCGGPWSPPSVTFPTLNEGGVATCLGTIFTEADGDDAVRYPMGDAAAAHGAGVRQLRWYQRWNEAGLIRLWRRGSPAPAGGPGISLGILMECADPIRTPDELEWWADQGVVAIGLTWARGSRYASGNAEPSCSSGVGLTDAGRELARRMDALGIVHDASHLSDRALADLLELTDAPVIASHSNSRSLLDGVSQRHLTDDAIREIGRRGGVIGLNLVRNFIRTGLDRADPNDRPSVDEAVAHVEHVCEVQGHRRGVGLGSDLDGGISAHDLPAGIDRPRNFERLAEALLRRGWDEGGVHAFAWGNWARFWRLGVTAAG